MANTFREYLRIATVHPDPDYYPAIEFLEKLGAELDLEANVIEVYPKKPVLVLKWTGSDESAESIFLNSHVDVVPVYKDKWTYDPFGADMDDAGNIYARGSQDMKCVGIQYLEAIRQLKKAGYAPRRNIFVSYVPDEEIGSILGMELFVKTDFFKSLNVGFGLDEGCPQPFDDFCVFRGERTIKSFRLTCNGPPGHASLYLENTAAEKFTNCLQNIQNFRLSEQLKLKNNPELEIGDVTTINMTVLRGGIQFNVIPATVSADFDMRMDPSLKFKDFCERVLPDADGENIIIEPIVNNDEVEPTSLESPYCKRFFSALEELNMKANVMICSGGTDGRFLRPMGIPVLGFSPINNTPILAHDHDEYLNVDIYLRGIEIYATIIRNISS